MGCAGDAGIVIAYELLALPRELVRRQPNVFFHEMLQVFLDSALVLGCGWHDFGVEYDAVVVDGVSVVEYSARCLSAAVTCASVWMDLYSGPEGWCVLLYDAQCFVACVEGFDAACDDAFEWVSAGWLQPCLLRGLLCR